MNARVAAVALVAAAAPACGNGVATAPLNVIYAVTVTVEDFLAGRDAVLDRAQEWMRERMAANPRR